LAADRSLADAFGAQITIVHIDWKPSNDYFIAKARQLLPRAELIPITIQEYQTLNATLTKEASSGDSRVIVVTRLPLETRILPQVPAGSTAHELNKNLVEVDTR
jgi:hypothetical protein